MGDLVQVVHGLGLRSRHRDLVVDHVLVRNIAIGRSDFVDRRFARKPLGGDQPTNSVTYTFDTTAPVVSGAPKDLITNKAFLISLKVSENFGYVSLRGKKGSYYRFDSSGTNITVSETVELSCFGQDEAGNTSITDNFYYSVVEDRQYLESDLSKAQAVGSPSSAGRGGITFIHLTSQTRISIFSISGKLIDEIVASRQTPPGTLFWSVETHKGQRVPAGIYVCYLTAQRVAPRILKVIVLP